ncbi:hypothetical protein D3C81_1301120 [compost metagenome]
MAERGLLFEVVQGGFEQAGRFVAGDVGAETEPVLNMDELGTAQRHRQLVLGLQSLR